MKLFFIIIMVLFLVGIGNANAGDIESAEGVMYAVKQYATIYEEGSHLVVKFHKFVHPYCPTSRHKLITMIADADCILTGKARTIFFYNPGRKLIGQADTLRGIRLINP